MDVNSHNLRHLDSQLVKSKTTGDIRIQYIHHRRSDNGKSINNYTFDSPSHNLILNESSSVTLQKKNSQVCYHNKKHIKAHVKSLLIYFKLV